MKGRCAEVNELKINIDEMTDIINEEARLRIMKEIADENLAYVNRHSQPVRYKDSFYTKYVKRLFDVVLSSVALVASLLINLVLGVCTYFDVGRPIFFRQKRIGKDGTTFEMINLRWMQVVCELHKIQATIQTIICRRYTTFWLPNGFRHSIAGFAGVFAA